MRIEYTTTEKLTSEAVRQEQVVIAMPATDLDMARRSAELMARRAGVPGLILVVMDEQRSGFIHTANTAFQQTEGTFFAYVAQDAFAGRLWMRVALHHIEKQQKDLLAFNDGKWHGLLASYGLVRRQWVCSLYGGVLFNPVYVSHYGDVELSVIARAKHRFCYSPRSVLVEIDWDKDTKAITKVDREMFEKRAITFFDGLAPEIEIAEGFPALRGIKFKPESEIKSKLLTP